MMRSGYRRTARAGVAVVGALVLGLGTTACGEDERDGSDSGDGPGTEQPDTGTPEEAEEDTGSTEPSEENPEDAESDVPGDPDGTEAEPGSGAEEGDGEVPEEGTQPEVEADAAAGDPFVINFYGEENVDGAPDQQPENLVLGEHSTVTDLVWEQWDGEQAVGSGLLSGMWCLPECQDEPIEATIVLSDIEDVNGEDFYSVFELDAPEAEEYEAPDLDGAQPLALP